MMPRRWLLPLAALWALESAAAAQIDYWTYETKRAPPPQRFLLELKFGTYTPHIDSTASLTGTPFSDLFREQTSPDAGEPPSGKLIGAIEFDWQFFHRFGSLAVAASAGYSRRTTHSFAFNTDGSPCTVPQCERSGDTTALNVIPLTFELVYRFDVLALRYRVPLVPYFKGGLGYYVWFIQNGSGDLANGSVSGGSDSAIGGTAGLVMHPGIAFMLDFLEPQAARTLDSESGIRHAYLFFELNYAWITGLGFSDKMVLSDTSWYAGMAAEF